MCINGKHHTFTLLAVEASKTLCGAGWHVHYTNTCLFEHDPSPQVHSHYWFLAHAAWLCIPDIEVCQTRLAEMRKA